MALRTPTPSLFRPRAGTSQAAIEENRALVRDITRRNLLRGSRGRHNRAEVFGINRIEHTLV